VLVTRPFFQNVLDFKKTRDRSSFTSPCRARRNGLRWEIARFMCLPGRTCTMRRPPPLGIARWHRLTAPFLISATPLYCQRPAKAPLAHLHRAPGGKICALLVRLMPRQRRGDPAAYLHWIFFSGRRTSKILPMSSFRLRRYVPISSAWRLLYEAFIRSHPCQPGGAEPDCLLIAAEHSG
jgi:hypothetical protein